MADRGSTGSNRAWAGNRSPRIITTTPIASTKLPKTKKKLTQENETLIGLRNPTYRYTSDLGANTGFDIVQFDTTTHGDRAILQLQNTSGASRVLGDNAIYGMPVIQIAGVGGFLWEYSDWDDIDTNGERFTEISNKFIINAAQCESIGDYFWKKYAPHKAYNFMLSGAHPEIEPGSIWDFTVNFTLNGNLVENIDAVIEVQAVKVNRNCKQIGMTSITGIIYDGAWSKTNSTRSRIVGAGRPQWMQNRSNVLVVASKDYAGQADYYCDGTEDDTEIQKAIDKLYLLGGGEVILTYGGYNIVAGILVKTGIVFHGQGNNTIITCDTLSSGISFISGNGYDNWQISDLLIDGESQTHTAVVRGIIGGGSTRRGGIIRRCTVKNLKSSADDPLGAGLDTVDGIVGVIGPYFGSGTDNIENCYIYNIQSTSASGCAYGIHGANRISNCTVDTVAGTISAGIHNSHKCQNNEVYNTTTKYQNAYADSGTSHACADTPDGGFNN